MVISIITLKLYIHRTFIIYNQATGPWQIEDKRPKRLMGESKDRKKRGNRTDT